MSSYDQPYRREEAASTVRHWPRYLYPIATAAAILGGLIPRLDNFARSLWAAEAWVANSVLANSLHGMFYYEQWLQTTPPLFLLLVRASVKLFGLSDYSLRAIPFLFGAAALALIAILAWRMFQPPFAVLCVCLSALSPPAIVYAKELKQYSADVFATCLILLVLWEYLQNSNRRHFVYLLLALALMLPLSYTAVVLVPLALWIVAFSETKGQVQVAPESRIRRAGTLGILASVIAGINYFVFIKPNSSALLTGFWYGGFPHWSSLRNVVRFYIENFAPMVLYFYFPAQSSTKDGLKSLVLSLQLPILLALGIAAIGATIALITALKKDHRHRIATLFFVFPFFTLLVLNIAHMYPVGSRRLTLFMVPCVLIVTTAGIEAAWNLFLAARFTAASAHRVLGTATALGVAGVLVLGSWSAGWDIDWSEDEDTESVFRYLRSNVQAGDTLYIHASVEEAARLYFRLLHWDVTHVRYGQTGLPCCKRKLEERPRDPTALRTYITQNFENTATTPLPETLWLVFTGRAEHWQYLNVREDLIIKDRLHELGCSKQFEQNFENEVIDKYSCLKLTLTSSSPPAPGE